MRLLIVTPYYAPAWGYGGPPKLLDEFARKMVKRGHNVTVVTTDALDHWRNPKRHETIGGVAVHRFPNRSNSLAWKQKLFTPVGLGDFLKQHVKNYDFVLSTDWRNGLNIACYKACSGTGIPYGIAAFGQLPLTHDLKRPIKQLFDRWYGETILHKAAVLFAQTAHEAAEYQKVVGRVRKIVLWPLAIDLKPFKKLPAKKTVFKKTILFVGRFNRYKGIDRLIASLAHLKKRLAVQLVLVGRDDGELLHLQRLITKFNLHDDVILPGPLYNEKVMNVYRIADVFVMTPTYSEETPLAGIMALAAGCPVVINQNAKIPWLEESGAGITLKTNEQLSSVLLNLLTNDKLLKRMGQAARQLARKRFTWQIRVKEFERYVKVI